VDMLLHLTYKTESRYRRISLLLDIAHLSAAVNGTIGTRQFLCCIKSQFLHRLRESTIGVEPGAAGVITTSAKGEETHCQSSLEVVDLVPTSAGF
jgi:hypothetical protein